MVGLAFLEFGAVGAVPGLAAAGDGSALGGAGGVECGGGGCSFGLGFDGHGGFSLGWPGYLPGQCGVLLIYLYCAPGGNNYRQKRAERLFNGMSGLENIFGLGT